MGIWGISFRVLVLIAGIVLTVITMLRMRSGQLALPTWAKVLLSAGMVLMLAITLFGILPPMETELENPFVAVETFPVVPVESVDTSG